MFSSGLLNLPISSVKSSNLVNTSCYCVLLSPPESYGCFSVDGVSFCNFVFAVPCPKKNVSFSLGLLVVGLPVMSRR